MESKFLTPLDGRWIDDEHFMLLAPLRYQSALLGGILTMPEGYVTDFASVPRIPIVYQAFGDKAHHESVPHDFIYQKHRVLIEPIPGSMMNPFEKVISRKLGDMVFLEAMIVQNKPEWVRNSMYTGVRVFGWNSYRTGPKRFTILNPNLSGDSNV